MRLAFVVPRYGEDILGGAETAVRHLAERLAQTGDRVEVLTTCAKSLRSWRNVYPGGMDQLNGVTVRRFPVDHTIRNEKRYWELTIKFTNRWPTTLDEEYDWVDQSAHSPELYAHLALHADEYDLLICAPYLFGITYYASTICPQRTVIWPCLHDEPFARFQQTRLMLSSCRGVMYNSRPEMMLARDKLGINHPRASIVGLGVESGGGDASRFRARFGVVEPFMLYAGRIDSMKNVLQMMTYFVEYRKRSQDPFKLLLMGEGELPIPSHPDIAALGFLDPQDKADAFAAAVVLCQPSLMESFSIVIMEAWLTGVPVLVHGDCDVTRHHVLRCGGGLYYSGFEEFASTLDWFRENPTARVQMGQQGQAYAQGECDWDVVLARFRQSADLWRSA